MFGQQRAFTLIELMIAVAILGIVAMMAIPFYEGFAARAQMAEALKLAGGTRTAVAGSYQTTGVLPESNQAAGLVDPESIQSQYVQRISVGGPGAAAGVITVQLRPEAPVHRHVRNAVLVLTPEVSEGGPVKWSCSGTFDARFYPSSCRGEELAD